MPTDENKEILEVVQTDFFTNPLKDIPVSIKAFNIGYVLGSVIHHCKQLAEIYSVICRTFALLPDPDKSSPDRSTFGHQLEPYYEFDALITAAHLAYDNAGKIIWHVFGPRGDAPKSFERAFEGCNRLPSTLKDRLDLSWSRFGNKINDYRDCIQHYAPLYNVLPYADMTRLQNGIWSTSIWIPDNPEVRSQNRFQYGFHLDALTYGWELTNEITQVTRQILNEVLKVETSR